MICLSVTFVHPTVPAPHKVDVFGSLITVSQSRQNRRLSRIFFQPADGGFAKLMAAKLNIFFGRRLLRQLTGLVLGLGLESEIRVKVRLQLELGLAYGL